LNFTAHKIVSDNEGFLNGTQVN